MNVARLIRDAATSYRGRVALEEIAAEDGGGIRSLRTVSYGDLYSRTLDLCAGLESRGITPPARVAVFLDNTIEMVVTEWACLTAGYIWVALNVRSSSVELGAILDDCRPALVVAAHRHAPVLERAGLPEGCVLVRVGGLDDAWTELLAAGHDSRRESRPEPSAAEPVRIRYTSGTLGTPKGAVLPRRCYDGSVAAVAEVIGPLQGDDVVLQVAPMTHASGAMLLPHVAVGARTLLAARFDVDFLVEAVECRRVTAVFLVPTMLIRLIELLATSQAARRVSTLRTIVYGGASMPVDRLTTALELLGPVLVQIYGLTESTWPIAALSRDDHLRRPGEAEKCWIERLHSCGRPTSVGQVRVVDEHGDDVEDGVVGELWVRGRNTMSGYWCQRGDDDGKGLDGGGWMHTGDLGYRSADGYLTIVDRLHDMIVSGGFNVYPREVESALSTHPAVLESAVVGRPSREWGEAVHAFVVLRSGQRVSCEELVGHCSGRIAGYKKPRSMDFVDSLPKNAAGKILRRELRDRLVSAR